MPIHPKAESFRTDALRTNNSTIRRKPMSVQENTRLDEEFLATWDAHDPDRALALLSDDAMWQDVSLPEPMRSKDAIRQYLQGWSTALPDMSTKTKNRGVSEEQV